MRAGWIEAAALLVLVGSLGLKLAVLDVAVGEDPREAVAALAAQLARYGVRAQPDRGGLPIVRVEQGSCRFSARVLDPHGTYRDTELAKLPRSWNASYAWHGGWNATLPRLGPLGDYYLAREWVRIGREAVRAPVVMVLHPSGCPLPPAAGFWIRARLQRTTPANRAVLS